MTLRQVLDQYLDHILRLANKKPTPRRAKGIAYYTSAAETLTTLINAPRPAWYDFHFDKKLY